MTDVIERALKKGKTAEQMAAAKLLSLVMVQLFGQDEATSVRLKERNIILILIEIFTTDLLFIISYNEHFGE